jgi:hypothetical protein
MKQVIYVLQFKGSAAPAAEGVLTASTKASSCSISTQLVADGLRSSLELQSGAEAVFESTVTLTGESTFQESGTIEFGRGHKVAFSTVGQGHIGPTRDPKIRHGSVIWRIDGGEGQFAGASGLITSNFTVSDQGEVIDNHFGVLYLG